MGASYTPSMEQREGEILDGSTVLSRSRDNRSEENIGGGGEHEPQIAYEKVDEILQELCK